MKRITVLAFLIVIACNAFSQKNKSATSDTCSKVLKELSYYWQLDSMGLNGYRLSNYRRLLNCNIDKISSQDFINTMGKPSFEEKDSSGYYYCYYFFDGRKIPSKYGYSEELLFLVFKFDKSNTRLLHIRMDAEDY